MKLSRSLLFNLRLSKSGRSICPLWIPQFRLVHSTNGKMDDEEMSLNNGGPSRPTAALSTPHRHLGADALPTGMSKSAAKKAAKKAYREATKTEFRAAERVKRKEKKAATMQEYRAGTLDEEERARIQQRIEFTRMKRRQKAGEDLGEGSVWKGGVVIDLGFDELMTDREVSSLAQQISYVYASNRKTSRPFSAILHTSVSPDVSPQLWTNVVDRGCAAWHRCFWWAENVDNLAKVFGVEQPRLRSRSRSISPHRSTGKESSGFGVKRKLHTSDSDVSLEAVDGVQEASQDPPDVAPDKPHDQDGDIALENAAAESATTGRVPKLQTALSGLNIPSVWSKDTHRLVYLSADAEEELSTLSEDEIYVLGGLVDKNRYKMLCENKARSLGIRTARLPIGSYIADLPTRKVLTVNQTFEILLKYIELNDWAEAFHTVIPQRKFAVVSKKTLLKQRKLGAPAAQGSIDDAAGELERGMNA